MNGHCRDCRCKETAQQFDDWAAWYGREEPKNRRLMAKLDRLRWQLKELYEESLRED